MDITTVDSLKAKQGHMPHQLTGTMTAIHTIEIEIIELR